MTDSTNVDIIIIGAGLAGLSAARTLSHAGKSVLVLEARERAGGRVLTRHDPHAAYPIEMGPEWLEGRGDWSKLLKSLNATLYAAEGEHFERRGTQLVNRDAMQDNMDALVAHLAKQLPDNDDCTLRESLDAHATDAKWDDAKQMLLRYVQGFHAADPDRLSTRWLAQVEDSEPADGSQHRAVAGLDWGIDALLLDLGHNCTVRLGAMVHAVRWDEHAATVHVRCGTTDEVFIAAQVLVTLPLAVLKQHDGQPGAVRFTPSLDAKREAFELLETGNVVKVVMVFRDAFWKRDGTMREVGFLQDFSQPIPTWWTTEPIDAPVITGWMGGPPADALINATDVELRRVSVESLAHATNVSVADIEAAMVGWHSYNWVRDPYSLGAYSYVRSGGAEAYKILAAPLGGTLFFAGEATEGGGHNATMEGAYQSGKRAAREILAASR